MVLDFRERGPDVGIRKLSLIFSEKFGKFISRSSNNHQFDQKRISKYNFETIQLGLNVIIPLIKQNSLFQIVYFKVRLFAKKRFPRSLTDQPFFSISNAYKNRTEKDLKKPRALLQSGDHF